MGFHVPAVRLDGTVARAQLELVELSEHPTVRLRFGAERDEVGHNRRRVPKPHGDRGCGHRSKRAKGGVPGGYGRQDAVARHEKLDEEAAADVHDDGRQHPRCQPQRLHVDGMRAVCREEGSHLARAPQPGKVALTPEQDEAVAALHEGGQHLNTRELPRLAGLVDAELVQPPLLLPPEAERRERRHHGVAKEKSGKEDGAWRAQECKLEPGDATEGGHVPRVRTNEREYDGSPRRPRGEYRTPQVGAVAQRKVLEERAVCPRVAQEGVRAGAGRGRKVHSVGGRVARLVSKQQLFQVVRSDRRSSDLGRGILVLLSKDSAEAMQDVPAGRCAEERGCRGLGVSVDREAASTERRHRHQLDGRPSPPRPSAATTARTSCEVLSTQPLDAACRVTYEDDRTTARYG